MEEIEVRVTYSNKELTNHSKATQHLRYNLALKIATLIMDKIVVEPIATEYDATIFSCRCTVDFGKGNIPKGE